MASPPRPHWQSQLGPPLPRSARLRAGRRAFYTAPIKALSNQKFRDFREEHADDVGIMTGDVTINPEAPLLIMTTEVFRNTIFEAPDADDLLAWLRRQPLMHHDATLGYTLVHAGLAQTTDRGAVRAVGGDDSVPAIDECLGQVQAESLRRTGHEDRVALHGFRNSARV